MHQLLLQYPGDVEGVASGAVGDLVTTTGAVGDDDGIGRLADRRKHRQFGHAQRDVIVMRLIAEAAGHATARAFDLPASVDADAVRRLIYERFDLSLGTGLGKLKGRMYRIGHLGDSKTT